MDPRRPALLSDFVLDASAAMVLVMDDEPEGPVMPIVHALTAGDPVVPTLWPYEVASALMVAHRTGRLGKAQLVRSLHSLSSIGCTLDDEPVNPSHLIAVAREHGVSSHDASYLALALRRGLPLATTDTRLRDAAGAAGVPLVW